jgi:hypothetical protein
VARVVLGIGTSHSPQFALPPWMWDTDYERMRSFPELVFPPDGIAMPYEEAISGYVSADVRRRVGSGDTMMRQAHACGAAIAELAQLWKAADPDVTLIVSDDQDEWFFEANMPALAVYWGASVPLIPLTEANLGPFGPGEAGQLMRAGYGDLAMDVPVASELGRDLIEQLIARDFDPAQITYTDETYGGRVARRYPTRDGELGYVRETPQRPRGLPHGFSFVVKRLMDNQPGPILPVLQNTCYPPNTPTPKRCYDLGVAIGEIVAGWPADLRVAVVASGGLSHFVVDEELDRMILRAIAENDAATLRALPRHRLYSATSESLNWVTVAGIGARAGLAFDLIDYVPVYRTDAGTGGGWAFGRWQ